MAQKYDWGWTSRFIDTGEAYEEAEGYPSKAAVIADVKVARIEEQVSLEAGFQTEETRVEYKIRRRPVFDVPPWEEVAG